MSRHAAHDAELIQRCLEIVRDEVSAQTMDAFHLFAVLGRPARDVARELRMTDNAVCGAKRRVLHRIREIAASLESGLERPAERARSAASVSVPSPVGSHTS